MNLRPGQRGRRSGVAMVVAVALVGIAGTAATVLIASIGADARRTRRVADEAQARQFLFAAMLSVEEKAAGWGETPDTAAWEMSLPAEARPSAGGARRVAVVPVFAEGKCEVGVDVVFGTRHLSESMWMERAGKRWACAGITFAP